MAERDFSINKRIMKCRRDRLLTQGETAKYLGIKVSTYSQMERNGHITAERLKSLAELFNVDIYYLLYGENKSQTVTEIMEVTPKKYLFLEDISSAELKLMKNILFHLTRDKRTCVYQFALDILNKKKSPTQNYIK